MMRVDFAETFEERLETISEFLRVQDPLSASHRMDELWEQIFRFRDLMMDHPELGRPAGFLAAQSIEGQARLDKLKRLAAEAGVPDFREYVLRSHVILYAHSEARVVILSIRHQRELGYMPESG
jgi:plasmid stabilization system protein ParE